MLCKSNRISCNKTEQSGCNARVEVLFSTSYIKACACACAVRTHAVIQCLSLQCSKVVKQHYLASKWSALVRQTGCLMMSRACRCGSSDANHASSGLSVAGETCW